MAAAAGSARRPGRRVLGLGLAAAVGLSAVLAGANAAAATPRPVSASGFAGGTASVGDKVIVSGPAGAAAAAAAVRAAGGEVLEQLPLVSGVAARLPAGVVLPGFVVAADRPLTVAGAASAPTTGATGPASTARATMGLREDSPTGRGVTVAVLDTGIADVPDLAGRVLHVDPVGTADVSDTGSHTGSDARDGYGHGTFVAGLVAGDGHSSAGAYRGAAPDAGLVDVRVADDDGSTSLTSVLGGLQFVATHASELHIRVLNLSLSSGSPLPYQLDPLTQGLEGLWQRGITVVTAAGNDGPTPGSVSSPGLDPTLLTVGALDESGTATRSDDSVAAYSSRGAAGDGKPDLVAPGSHLVSLRAPGSVVDAGNPGSRVGDAYFRGSGTSMATGLVSGAAADLLSARPSLTPDQVKALLTGTAYCSPGLREKAAAGAGGVDVAAALAARAPRTPSGSGHDDSIADFFAGLSPAQAAVWDRFSAAVLDGDPAAAVAAWRQLSPEGRSWARRSWSGLDPVARSWTARSWSGRSWAEVDGSAEDWLARSWAADLWVARSWSARSWSARSWTARSWSARSWSARSWSARSWSDGDWAGRSWAARSWSGRSWAARSWSTAGWS